MTTSTVSKRPAPGKSAAKPPKTRMKRFAPHLPYEDFPLFPLVDQRTGAGRWAKKIKGKLHYFGPLEDWQAAKADYDKHKDRLHAGLPRLPDTVDPEALTVFQLCDSFYEFKRQAREAGEITARSLADYDTTCKIITKHLDRAMLVNELTPDHFAAMRVKMAKKRGPVSLGNEMNRVKMVFRYYERNYPKQPRVAMGDKFKRPQARVLRLDRAKHERDHGERTMERSEILQLIDRADVQMKAMILLGINCGLGNSDVAELCFSHLDFENAMLVFPRPKTGINRRAILWPETIKALKVAIEHRYTPTDPADSERVFITKYKNAWSSDTSDNPVSKAFTVLLNDLGIKRDRLSFYALRHTFRTEADQVGDDKAANLIMGHEGDGMSKFYVHKLRDNRLRKIADHVRGWLFAKPVKGKGKATKKAKAKPAAKRPALKLAS